MKSWFMFLLIGGYVLGCPSLVRAQAHGSVSPESARQQLEASKELDAIENASRFIPFNPPLEFNVVQQAQDRAEASLAALELQRLMDFFDGSILYVR